jgi:type IV pilus assembly protein PilE
MTVGRLARGNQGRMADHYSVSYVLKYLYYIMVKEKGMRQCGFTLIELMIALAVVAVLTAVALPSYNSYMARGRITDAVTGLSDYRVRMEQYFQDNRNYGTASTACPVPAPSSSHFTFTCIVGSTVPTSTYTATASSAFGTPGAYTYVVNQQNGKSTTTFKGASVTKACWLIKGTEC